MSYEQQYGIAEPITEDGMQDVTTAESEPEPNPLEPVVEELRGQIDTLRRSVASGIAELREFKQEVRATVIEKIKEGVICKSGSNEVLEEWGLEPYNPTWRVLMNVELSVIVEADDEDDAGALARQSFSVEGDDDALDVSVEDKHVVSVTSEDE